MLLKVADTLVFHWLGLDPASAEGAAVHFFVYDSTKIFLLLGAMIFAIAILRTWLPEERLKGWMGRGGIGAHVVAAIFGAITPFCSCSSIPIFISLLKAGVPLGAAFSFLVTSPLINEYLVVLMAGEFGVPITVAYVASGLAIGIGVGVVLDRMKLENCIEADMSSVGDGTSRHAVAWTWGGRVRYGCAEAIGVIRQIWIWVLAGVAVGSVIHNYVPQEMVHSAIEKTGFLSVPIATLLGVPMYGSCAAIVPVAVVLFNKGVPLGTALAFMMAMAGLSLPEAIMLRRAMKLKLIAIFFGVTALAIMVTGYLFNWLALFL